MIYQPYYLVKDLRRGTPAFASKELIKSGDYEEIMLNEYWLNEMGFQRMETSLGHYYTRIIFDYYQLYTNVCHGKDTEWYIQGVNEKDSLRIYTISDYQDYLLRFFNYRYLLATHEFVRRNPYPTVIYSGDGIVEDINLLMLNHGTNLLKIPMLKVDTLHVHIGMFAPTHNVCNQQMDLLRKVLRTGESQEEVRELKEGIGYTVRSSILAPNLIMSTNRDYYGCAPHLDIVMRTLQDSPDPHDPQDPHDPSI